MLPFACNTFVFASYAELSEKDLAQRLLPCQINNIRTIKCAPQVLFYEFHKGTVASRHCLLAFADLGRLECLVLGVGGMQLSEDDKGYLVEKIREAYMKEELRVEFVDERIVTPVRANALRAGRSTRPRVMAG
jgi:hypothetical protein